jgi:hypothetical protein
MRFFHPLGAEGPGGAKIAGDRRDQQAFAIGSSSARKVCDDGLTDVGDHGLCSIRLPPSLAVRSMPQHGAPVGDGASHEARWRLARAPPPWSDPSELRCGSRR